MKSLKNHFSLIAALFTILFTIQVYQVLIRSISSYEENLRANYSIIVISNTKLEQSSLKARFKIIRALEEISPDNVIKRLKELDKTSLGLLKATLPKFYKLSLNHYPEPSEIEILSSQLLNMKHIKRVESFAQTHDQIYKLLLLYKGVTQIFAFAVFVVTLLLIAKEMRIWQFQHQERMNIMALFGAPVMLRSAVLFRLAIIDAIIAASFVLLSFSLIIQTGWVEPYFKDINIQVNVFDFTKDSFMHYGIALSLSILLALMLIVNHKEEV
ncbi:cell division protein FtsX [Sulfurimonas sp. MAG313]|nr:cell division protein FtsX [Sulfurimonas sp. MAG313]MDF1882247.1 cell division protein FtsX [Sulfurimonas sp. MAG313]